MVQRKTAVTPLLMHWSYCSLVLSHRNVLQLHRYAGPCVWYGPVFQIIAVRKYVVDTIRNYVIRLLTSPDVMCKYNLIKPQNNN